MLATAIQKPNLAEENLTTAFMNADQSSKSEVVVVTGGAGYIGSHVVHFLTRFGFKLVVVDDLSAGTQENLNKASGVVGGSNIVGEPPSNEVTFFEGDFADVEIWQKIVEKFNVVAVVHLAAKIDANESISQPEIYLETNLSKTKQLLEILKLHNITNLVFASTAAVYGACQDYPITEQSALQPLNPYGESKMLAEQAIRDSVNSDGLRAVVLRFFNAAGTSSEINILPQNPHGLLQQLKAVIDGSEPVFSVYGDDYETSDGTCIRDLVHVVDIARAVGFSVRALIVSSSQLESETESSDKNMQVFNVGSGTGYSIKQILDTAQKIFSESSDKKIEIKIAPRRENEIPISVADNSLIKSALDFGLQFSDLESILRSSL